jgi:ribosomal protein S18 acetylase RimI-like enzyme
VHFAAYDGEWLVGIASLYREDRPRAGTPHVGWRLRGMASIPEARRRGVGRRLLDACVEHVANAGGGELWCNARTPAAGFYAKAGFEVISEPFEIPGIGPHVVMRRFIPSQRSLEDEAPSR